MRECKIIEGENSLNLHDYVVQHPAATFFVKAASSAMQASGIFAGDIVVVDRSLSPAHGKIVLAVINGEFVLRRMETTARSTCVLTADDKHCPPITLKEGIDYQIWGVVTFVIHKAE